MDNAVGNMIGKNSLGIHSPSNDMKVFGVLLVCWPMPLFYTWPDYTVGRSDCFKSDCLKTLRFPQNFISLKKD